MFVEPVMVLSALWIVLGDGKNDFFPKNYMA